MKFKRPFIVGCLAMGLAFAGQLSLAGSNGKQDQASTARSEPKTNDYSNLGVDGYTGTKPQSHTQVQSRKEFRNEEEPREVPPRANPVVNDYSNLGAEYGGDSPSPASASSEPTTPTVNDYSSMGAEYGSESKKTKTENADTASAGRLEPPKATKADLIVGYGKYHASCAQCHGEDAVGSSFAPSLVTRLKKLDYPTYVDVVTNGKTVFDSTTGGYSVMPAWKTNAAVMAHLDEIWAYLKGRAEGEVSSGRPQ
jgi:mono/diheme cytochrome c family protein